MARVNCSWAMLSTGAAGMVAGLALFVSSASGLPLFTAHAQLSGSQVANHQQRIMANFQTGDEVRASNSYDDSAQASALASITGLRAHGYGRVNAGSAGGTGTATARYTDFVIQGPPGPVATSFNMFLSGNLTTISHNILDTISQAGASAWIELTVNGLIVTGDPFSARPSATKCYSSITIAKSLCQLRLG